MVLIGGLKKYFLNVDQLLSIIPPCWISLYFVMMKEEEIKVGCRGFFVSRIHLLFNPHFAIGTVARCRKLLRNAKLQGQDT
jgi:hypothetical protein